AGRIHLESQFQAPGIRNLYAAKGVIMAGTLTLFLRKTPMFLRMVMGLLLSLSMGGGSARTESEQSTVVFCYGDRSMASQLCRVDLAVVELEIGFVPALVYEARTHWLAYGSIGEASSFRDYCPAIPKSWIIGRNQEWQADIIAQTAQGWPEFFVDHVLTPLW